MIDFDKASKELGFELDKPTLRYVRHKLAGTTLNLTRSIEKAKVTDQMKYWERIERDMQKLTDFLKSID